MRTVPPPHLAAALTSEDSVHEAEPGIWRHAGAGEGAQYDSIGHAYDVVAGLDLYHRVFWGVSTREYRSFAEAAAADCGEGTLLDAGCGSMLFTAGAHKSRERGTLIGVDASLEMLRLARNRIGLTRNQGRVALLNANVLRSPFRTGAVDVVVCLHVAHVLPDLEEFLAEVRRIVRPGGRTFLTTLVLVDGWRDRYLRALSRRKIVATPRRQEDVLTAVRTVFGTEPGWRLAGNMLFVRVTSPAR